MDWSDEEGEILPDFVDEYYFVDERDIPIEFCVLPLKWDDGDSADISGLPVFLRGGTDCADYSFCKLSEAWKFDLSEEHPKIEVLLHGMHWITLRKPAKSYESLVRTTLATLECLHFVKRNPEASSDDVWNSLHKVDGIQPSENDLTDHVSLLCQAMKRDYDLTKSKCLHSFLEKTSQTTPSEVELLTRYQEDGQIPEEQNFTGDNRTDEENSSDDDYEMNLQFDTVCSICDNGGYILCCEGSCLRAFHATIEDGIDSSCESLGFTDGTQVHALGTYLCSNFLHKQHQCFACGQLGSSDESSSQEVFPCSASNCGHFYHPICVAKLLYADDHNKSEELQAKIAANDSFCCPLHICKVCKTSENKNLYAFHFAVCRRCPTAYHRKCLPWEITSELNGDEENPQRTWEKLLPYNRILMYCLNHEIVGDLGTPARDHLTFPDISGPRRTLSEELAPVKEDVPSMVTDSEPHEGLPDRLGINECRKPKMHFNVNDYLLKRKMDSIGKNLPIDEGHSAFVERDVVDEDVEQRVLSIRDEVNSSFNFDEFMRSRGATTNVKCYQSGYDIGKNITTGLVKTHVNAARAALKMFEEGRGEDARAIFDPDILLQLMNHKRKLEIYLSPFFHGKRYTSFGRHFTKQAKLVEIVERLHLYVQSGDTYNFNFEKRDWLSVKKQELPDGSRLIMGLNPPFGYKSSLANIFIRKALEFRPKILILIVPSETKRVDEIAEYDLIWEDTRLLSGMSFYLPGSIDVNDQTIEQWNNMPPPLYLWSRRDWSRSHKAIALQQSHITQMHHSTCTGRFHHAEVPQDYDDMVQDMDLSV
ncbi:unnamed protein product [Thlaspi arvense]|uniref:Zinc finger PHD-type domain-containing protein n=1 Tax=Thlaspi arvense TaxID=13288 RepID=A0AAU9RKZ7_THLAR|nr:unnamed protein product [Thlaspi arvense]